MNVLVFDIETIPDVEGGRRLYDLDGLSDKEVADVMHHMRRQETGDSDFLRLHLHKVAAISAVLRSGEGFKVWSLGEIDAPEQEIIQRFFDGLDKYVPTLVSWNGSGFDLPVLHYRALRHGVSAPRYWDVGDSDREFKWSNYRPLSLAPYRFDGRAGRLSGARQCAAGSNRHPAGFSRQDGHERRQGVGQLSRR